jgi:very-short-patch-repair endonuclease
MQIISPALRLEFREFCVGLVLRQIDDVFQMAGIQLGTIPNNRNVSGERRIRVEEYYASIDWGKTEDTQKFLHVLGLVLSQTYISEEQKDSIREMCLAENLIIEGQQIRVSEVDIHINNDLFIKQFSVGLPFGVTKPDFAITARDGGQSVRFELKSGIGIIWRDVYPNFDFQLFQTASGITASTNLALKRALFAMNQTENEKIFFQTYAKHFGMADNRVPLLIPQAWIQWHSLPKRILRDSKRDLADELYRVDFVLFWANQRYAILIDDISHYAVKSGDRWFADEKSYSKRLDEDRKLQAEGWKIFRVSNWEIKQNRVQEILLYLQKFIGF